MKLEIREDSLNYACSVVEIKEVFPIEGADKIARVVVNGNSVVVSKDVQAGDKMLYFVSGTQLSADFCKYNNLFDRSEENMDISEKGFISYKQRRVKAIKLRGIVSDGMLMPLKSLDVFHLDFKKWLVVGNEFTNIEGYSLCEKYVVPVKPSTQGGEKTPKANKLKDLIVDNQFRFHTDTAHFAKHLDTFTPDTEVIITRKMHGSSLILSNVLVNKALSWKDKLARFFGVKVAESEYGTIWSSGKPKGRLPKGLQSETNLWESSNPSYYTSDIWARAYKQIGHAIEKGISLYGEIVGVGIQGDKFTYNQEYGIYVYRITQTSVDGGVVELSWEQVKKYCEKYGLTPVEEYFVGKVREFAIPHDNLLEILRDAYLNKSYKDCAIDEGICIRVRNTDEIFKLKSRNFIKMESDDQENGVEEKES